MNKSLMKYSTAVLFLMTIIIMLSSNSLLMVWFFLELNMILFIPLHSKQNMNSLNNLMKYFITQSLASLMFLMLILTQNFLILQENLNLYMSLVLSLKLGMFPFSSWYFQVTENMEWQMWFLTNTLQKIIPLWLIANYNNIMIINVMIMLNSVYSSIEMWSQNSIRWILNSSSLNHMSWMLLSLNTNTNNWEIYMMSYCWLSFNMLQILKYNNNKTLMTTFNYSFTMKILLTIALLNFMGMPPMTGFLPKLLIIKTMNSMILTIPLVMNNTLLMFFYLTLIKNFFLKKKNYKMKMTPSFTMMLNSGLSTSMMFYMMIIF